MSRFLRISTRMAALLLLLPGFAAVAADVDPKLEEVRAKVSAMFAAIDPEDVGTSPIDGWYTIQKGSIVAYVSDDGRYLLQGDLIDLETQINLSELSRSETRRGLVESLSDEESIMFSPAEPKYSVTIFTDIDCTYCRRLHAQIDEYLSAGIAVRYVLYPRNGPSSRAWSKSEEVWCSNDRPGALTAAKLDREFQTSKCDASILSKHYALGRDVGLTGTPAIVLGDGTLISGYLPPETLSARLAGSNP